MNIAVAVTTAPREGPPLLPRCIGTLTTGGFENILVFAEPLSDIPDNLANVEVVQRREKLGCWRNWVRSLKNTLERRPDADAVMMVQDDIVLCSRLKEFLQGDLWPSAHTGVVHVCVSQAYAGQPRGLSPLRKNLERAKAGAWAVVFPRHVAYQVVASALTKGWRGHPTQTIKKPSLKKGVDTFIQETITKLGYEVWFYNPSLGDHDSVHSSLNHGGTTKGNRSALRFIGVDGDPFAVHPPGPRVDLPTCFHRRPDAKPLELAVVIPMAGSCGDLMDSCLEHLALYAGVPLKVYVVDNGTPADVGEQVDATGQRLGLDLQRLRNENNEGFSKAINQGIVAAGSRHVLLLNSDCRVGPNCIPLLVHGLSSHRKVAAIGPVTSDKGYQSLRRRALYKPVPDAAFAQPNDIVWRLGTSILTKERSLAFFCTLVNHHAIKDIGLLSEEEIFATGLAADDEWCHRAGEKKWRLLIHHGAFADHSHSETFRRLGMDRGALAQKAWAKLRTIKGK